jgi:CRISPR-associated endonuclease/helicase Cas3
MPDTKLSDLIAHSAPEDGGEPQSLDDHLRGVARRAAGFAEAFESEPFARWLGWWHDAGKVHGDFQDYIEAPDEQAHGPDHSSIGMLAANAFMWTLGFNAAGHHGGLSDRDDLRDRIKRKQYESRMRHGCARHQRAPGPAGHRPLHERQPRRFHGTS